MPLIHVFDVPCPKLHDTVLVEIEGPLEVLGNYTQIFPSVSQYFVVSIVLTIVSSSDCQIIDLSSVLKERVRVKKRTGPSTDP